MNKENIVPSKKCQPAAAVAKHKCHGSSPSVSSTEKSKSSMLGWLTAANRSVRRASASEDGNGKITARASIVKPVENPKSKKTTKAPVLVAEKDAVAEKRNGKVVSSADGQMTEKSSDRDGPAIKKAGPDDVPHGDRPTDDDDSTIVKPAEKKPAPVDRSTSTEIVNSGPAVAMTANNTQTNSSSSSTSSTSTTEPSSSSASAAASKPNFSFENIFVPAAAPKDAELPEGLLKLIELILDDDVAFDELMSEIMIARWKMQRNRCGSRMSRSFTGESSAVRGCEISRIPVRVAAGDADRRKTIASTLNTAFIQH